MGRTHAISFFLLMISVRTQYLAPVSDPRYRLLVMAGALVDVCRWACRIGLERVAEACQPLGECKGTGVC